MPIVMLRTPRLLLREFRHDDWMAVLEYQSDQRYLRFYPWSQRTEADVRPFVQQFVDWQAEQPRCRYQLAIVLPVEGRLIGNCGLRKAFAEAHEAELGLELAPDHWGRGYATEAALAMLGFGFEELRLHRVWSGCLAENAAAARVLEKLGMVQEGRQRENRWMKERWWDTVLYGLLEHEWKRRAGARHLEWFG